MNLHRNLAVGLGLLGLLGLGLLPASAQRDYGARLGQRQGDEYSYAPQGPGVMLNAVDPAMRKWYVPQELYLDYRWRQWDYTNYARDHYQRYIDTTLEGEHFYDIYGNFLTRGWLIYNNSQTTPEQFGNSVLKSNRFRDWFSGVVVTHDQKGEYHFFPDREQSAAHGADAHGVLQAALRRAAVRPGHRPHRGHPALFAHQQPRRQQHPRPRVPEHQQHQPPRRGGWPPRSATTSSSGSTASTPTSPTRCGTRRAGTPSPAS